MLIKPLVLLGLLVCLTVEAASPDQTPVPAWAVTGSLPAWETRILLGVGREYDMNDEELKLLLAIRKVENGRTGLEMGVASDYPAHRARRYPNHPEQSLRVQARWAAGTIKKRYAGDLEAFAKVYCPPQWQHWMDMTRYWMTRERTL